MKKSPDDSDKAEVSDRHNRIRTAWLFTRGDTSVHSEVNERRDGFRITVKGPGIAVASHHFADREALLAFARDQERELKAAGFQLQAVAERRSGVGANARGGERRNEVTDRRHEL